MIVYGGGDEKTRVTLRFGDSHLDEVRYDETGEKGVCFGVVEYNSTHAIFEHLI